MHPRSGVCLRNVPRSIEDVLKKIKRIEDNLKDQLENLRDIKLSLLDNSSAEYKIPTGIVNVDLVHRVIDTEVEKPQIENIGRNMNEEY